MTLAPRLLAPVLLAAALCAQDWRPEPIVGVGLEIDAPSRLERLPMQLGDDAMYHRARFRPKDNQDYVRAQYYWYCDVYEFSKKPDADAAKVPEGIPPEVAEQLKKLMENSSFKRKTTFKEWLDAREHEKTIEVAGKVKKGRGDKLEYAHWVWQEKSGYGPCQIEHCEAAVYTFEDREVALVIEMPRESPTGALKSKWKTIIDKMITSGRKLDAAAAEDTDAKRDKYADTPEKKEALAAAKANIAGLQGWDYFTQPNYIVIYSWDFEKPQERSQSKKDAEFYSSRLEKMRELYLGNYPLDPTGLKAVMPDAKTIPSLTGPTTGAAPAKPEAPKPAAGEDEEEEPEMPRDRTPRKPYPVFRLCAAYDQFQKYGQSPPGVVGWFSPGSKELVVFLGGDKMMEPGATETVTYHEGWHQYADFYFNHPDTKKSGTLHRWFDEGHGDYFGSFRWGSNGWKYVGSKMRYTDVKQMVNVGDYVPFKDLVHWDRRRFYSGRAAYYYAQAFSMIDFLRRGAKSQSWDPRWTGVLDMYRKVMLVEGDSKLASDTAFFKFTPDDWKALEEAWKSWVKSPQFMSGGQ